MADPSDLHDTDPYAWTLEQADALRDAARTGRLPSKLDLQRLIEELELMGVSDRARIESLTRWLLEHLLYLEHAAAEPPRRRWELEVIEARAQLEDHLTAGLRRHLAGRLEDIYRRARKAAARKLVTRDEPETAAALPEACPYTLAQVLDQDWLPERRA
jgi:hypothetical protein